MSKNNGWIPLDENLKSYLPKDRPYSAVEALFCHQLDMKNNVPFSIRGYAKLWQWSRRKAMTFMDKIRDPQGIHKGSTRDPPVHLIILDLQKQVSHKGSTVDPQGSRTIRDKIKNKNKRIKDYAPKTARTKNIWKNSEDLMTVDQFIEFGLKDKRRHINIIAEYADEQKMDFKTKGQWHEFITRNVRYATKLAPFDDGQLSTAMKQVKSAGYLEKYTLETLHKFLVK